MQENLRGEPHKRSHRNFFLFFFFSKFSNSSNFFFFFFHITAGIFFYSFFYSLSFFFFPPPPVFYFSISLFLYEYKNSPKVAVIKIQYERYNFLFFSHPILFYFYRCKKNSGNGNISKNENFLRFPIFENIRKVTIIEMQYGGIKILSTLSPFFFYTYRITLKQSQQF